MSFRHGVYKQEVPTSLLSPVHTEAGLPVIVGTAPVHLASDEDALKNVNKPKLVYNYNEAVSLFGFSDDWSKYTLSEFIYSQFALFGVSPCVLINVLDPSKHKAVISPREYDIVSGEINLGQDVILANGVTFDSGAVTYEAGKDYSLAYDDNGNAIFSVIAGGKLANAAKVSVGFTQIKPDMVTANDIIGGVDSSTGKYTGLELVDQVYPKFRIVPGLLCCPKWSSRPGVAAVMRAKVENIDGVFTGMCVVDIPCDSAGADVYSEVPEWKNQNNYMSERQIVCWPKIKLDDRVFHLSTQLVGLMNQTDADNGDIPYASPSNKLLQMNACVNDAGEEIDLSFSQANYLNSQGVVTALNFSNGWVAWGNRTGCYPSNTDVKDNFINMRRMFDWVGNKFILTFWSKVDDPANALLIRTVLNSFNYFLNGLTSQGAIIGGRIEFLTPENPLTDLQNGKLCFHVYLTPPPPAEQIWAVMELWPDYFSTLFSSVA